VDFYTNLANQARREAMKVVFLQFAKEEKGHKERLTRIKENKSFEFKEKNVPKLKIADYKIEVEPNPNMRYEDALVLAMNKEKSAFKLYNDMANSAPNAELRDLFLALALDEAKHKLRFEIEYDDNVMQEN
jgi:rubrerythrin